MPATEETYRKQPALHVVFAVSSIAMLLVIVWMIMADHLRGWKQVQRDFHRVETRKLEALKQEKERTRSAKVKADLVEVDRKLKEADDLARQNAPAIRGKEREIARVKAEYQLREPEQRFLKAEIDAQRSEYDLMIDREEKDRANDYIRAVIKPNEDRFLGLSKKVEAIKLGLAQHDKELADLRGNKEDWLKKKEDLEREVSRVERVLAQKESQYGEGSPINHLLAFMRGLPGIDMAAPPEKIQQISLPSLTINYNFKDVPRYDRCLTCHMGIDKLGYDKDVDGKSMKAAHPAFAAHPHLADGYVATDPSGKTLQAGLYLDSNGPHPINSFGCTICHGGQGSGTDFTYASHTPNDLEQKEHWEKTQDWREIHHWDEPMLPARFQESSCLKCHHQVTDVPQAAKLQKGYDRIVKFGCTGCHTIGGAGSFGPDLTDARKVGPNLAHIAYKTTRDWTLKWIKNPHAFRPDTRMPRFYGLTNNHDPEDLPKSHAEIHAITHYLYKRSTKPQGFQEVPAKGNAKAGKELFLQKGCMACHAHKEYAPETFADRDNLGVPLRDFAKADFGPNLSNVAAKFVAKGEGSHAAGVKWLANWIKAPEEYHPYTLMPNLQLSWQDSADIAEWIMSVPAGWPKGEVTIPDVNSAEVTRGLDDLVRLYLGKSNSFKGRTVLLSEVDTFVATQLTTDEKLDYLGERTIGRLGCFGCHEIPGFENAKPIGTPLNGWGAKSPTKLDYGHITEYLTNQKADDRGDRDGTSPYYQEKLVEHTRAGFLYQKVHRPRSYDYKKTKEELKSWDERLRMPQFTWADDPAAVEEVMTFVLGLTGEKIDGKYLPRYKPEKAAVAQGERLLDRYNCRGCHVLAMPRYTIDAGTRVADALPSFDVNVSSSHSPEGRGSDYLGEFYPGLKYDPNAPPTLDADDGSKAYEIQGMPIALEENDDGKPVLQLVQLWQPATVRGYRFNVGDNVLVNLSKIRGGKPTPPEGGNFAWLYATDRAEKGNARFADLWNRLPPPLIREGYKVQTPWLTRFLKDPYAIRPAANLRMPRFHFADPRAETRDLANYFPGRDGAEFPYQDLREREQTYLSTLDAKHPDYLGDGWRVMSKNNSACLSCHAIGANKLEGGAEKINGPNLRQVDDRFRPRYLLEWLANPMRLVPYTVMPQNVKPHGDLGVFVPDSFLGGKKSAEIDEARRLEIIKAMRDTLLNYATAAEGQLAGATQPATPAAEKSAPKDKDKDKPSE